MAKSKSGGTRSYIRGRVGADVYSIGKDGIGNKQQVVRSLAETVANPQTPNQMRGRMIMSTLMQVVSSMSAIIDHSFDGVVAGMPSLAHFESINYALIKADVAAHPTSGNVFGLSLYKEKGAKKGAYVVASGKAELPAALVNAASGMAITLPSGAVTVAGLKTALGLADSEYITLVGIGNSGNAEFVRMRIRTDVADTTAISGTDASAFFALEGNVTPSFAVASNIITVALPTAQANSAVIISKVSGSGYIHNNATLIAPASPEYTAEIALATYPIGSQRFLNGGDDVVASSSNSGGSGSGTGGGGNSDDNP